jgi:hypothetical protein
VADFLTIAGVLVLIPRGQAEEQPDGVAGKRRWQVTTAPVSRADEATIRATIGAPGASESERAFDGTLWTNRALVSATGEAFAAAEGGSASVLVEATITTASYRHWQSADAATVGTRRALTLVLREA